MSIKIADREIGEGSPVFIIAELSANHLQDYNIAVETIKAIKESGADAVKLQTYTPDTITLNSNKYFFKIKHGPWKGLTLYELYEKAFMPWEWIPDLKKLSEDLDLICFSSPFDKTAVDFLKDLNMPAYKIASFEITDIPLIEYVAAKNKPVIISTGIAKLSDIEEAVNACKKIGNNQIALLKCTSSYPAPLEGSNLKTISNMRNTFKTVVGLSDHTIGSTATIIAVAMGAKIIEKHFILDKRIGGPDSSFSMEPDEFKKMVCSIREAEKAIGKVDYSLSEDAIKNRDFRRSLFIVEDINAGEIFTENNIKSIRPGFGLPPKYLKKIIGKKAKGNIKKGMALSWFMIK